MMGEKEPENAFNHYSSSSLSSEHYSQVEVKAEQLGGGDWDQVKYQDGLPSSPPTNHNKIKENLQTQHIQVDVHAQNQVTGERNESKLKSFIQVPMVHFKKIILGNRFIYEHIYIPRV